jgi:uncharacterized protein YkwD
MDPIVQRSLRALLVTVAVAMALVIGPAPAPHAAPAGGAQRREAAAPTTSNAYESRILQLVNAERTRRGLRPLRPWACADGFAERWSAYLARSKVLKHQSMATIMRSCRARTVGENIGYGAVSADAMVRLWMGSSAHRRNILNPTFAYIGLGAVNSGGHWYAVQEFMAF